MGFHRLPRTQRFSQLASLAGLSLVAVALAAPGLAGAQGFPPSDDDVNRVAKQLYCPVCENIPLDVCPTQACVQWRQVIRDRLAAGWSDQQVKDYFVEQYGVRVLAAPPARGLNVLIYALPPLAFLAGVVVFYRAVRTWPRPALKSALPPPPIDDAYARRLEEEIRRRD